MPTLSNSSSHHTFNPTSNDVDTFEHILEVTSNQEAVYAYYFMDENNKVHFLFDFYFVYFKCSNGM